LGQKGKRAEEAYGELLNLRGSRKGMKRRGIGTIRHKYLEHQERVWRE